MSRTYRSYPSGCFRHPRGRLRAIRLGCRKGSIPPDAWDDIPFSNEVWIPQKVAYKFLAYGMGAEEVTEMIRGRFRLPRWRSERIVRLLVRNHWRREQWRAKYEASHDLLK